MKQFQSIKYIFFFIQLFLFTLTLSLFETVVVIASFLFFSIVNFITMIISDIKGSNYWRFVSTLIELCYIVLSSAYIAFVFIYAEGKFHLNFFWKTFCCLPVLINYFIIWIDINQFIGFNKKHPFNVMLKISNIVKTDNEIKFLIDNNHYNLHSINLHYKDDSKRFRINDKILYWPLTLIFLFNFVFIEFWALKFIFLGLTALTTFLHLTNQINLKKCLVTIMFFVQSLIPLVVLIISMEPFDCYNSTLFSDIFCFTPIVFLFASISFSEIFLKTNFTVDAETSNYLYLNMADTAVLQFVADLKLQCIVRTNEDDGLLLITNGYDKICILLTNKDQPL